MNYREAYNIEDLRRIAADRLPRIAYDFLERGAEEEVTLAGNRAVFEHIRLQPRTLVDVSKRSQKKTLWGKTFDAPFGVAPTGASGMYCFDADVKIARAARRANLPCVLSTASFVPMERVIQEAGGTLWFQLYMSKDLETAERLVRRALAAGFEALVLTTDIPVAGNREFNRRNQFEIPLRLGPRQILDGLLHPRWLTSVFLRTLLTSGIPRFQNLDVNVGGRIVSTTLTGFRQRREELNWEDLAWLRKLWPKKLLVKGVLTVEDAQLAARYGADGIFVSNHGGRQLDGAPSPIEILPQIADAVGDRLAIMVDSGFRRGTDIVKALALGADMVFVGRATLYGASAGGEEGVLRAVDLLKSEIDRVMALLGCTTVDAIGPEHLRYDSGGTAGQAPPSASRRRAV
ncbi:MAG: alpha-hydroxy-acid oxidizing protein [Betaproteobacteria bacterium]|nr:MAG: alpha-hydroxy-acid oxidizing protein [Betaproteobacteria bacterium]